MWLVLAAKENSQENNRNENYPQPTPPLPHFHLYD